jgi:hypothetical protein
MQQLAREAGGSQFSYFPTSTRINIAGKPARAVLWAQREDNLSEIIKLSADVIMPCDRQLPWKKLQFGFLHSVGLTINGEVYVRANFRDRFSGTFVRRQAEKEDFNDFYAAYLYAGFSRFFSPDAPVAFKDFSIAYGFTNFYSDTQLPRGLTQWSALTLVTADSRVFVVGSGGMGEHGIPPDADKPNATLERPYVQYYDNQVFWQSTVPPYFPVATEISLPEGVGAAAVPQDSIGSVIGDDGQLYAWWRDPSNGTMYPPKKITGFVTNITMTSTGSPVKELKYDISGIPNQDEVRRWTWLDFSEPPAGGTKPVAYAEFRFTNPYRLSGRVFIVNPGMGYTTPPSAWLNGIEWYGAPAEFSCDIFESSDSFSLPMKADSPWLIGSDGCVYYYTQPFVIMRPYRVAGSDHNGARFTRYAAFKPLAPIRATAPGVSFKYAGSSCLIAEDGSYYVPFPRGADRDALPFETESAVLDFWGDTPPTTEYNDYGVSIVTNLSLTDYGPQDPDAIKSPYALFKIGSGFESGTCNVPLTNVNDYLRYAAAGIKEDGTMWTAGSNLRGLLGDNDDLFSSRKSFQQIAEGTEWVSVKSANNSGDVSVFYAVRKDAVCRSRTQDMEYVRDDYYSNPVLR